MVARERHARRQRRQFSSPVAKDSTPEMPILAAWLEDGVAFTVQDDETGKDITRVLLA
jgi:hypothetical protein